MKTLLILFAVSYSASAIAQSCRVKANPMKYALIWEEPAHKAPLASPSVLRDMPSFTRYVREVTVVYAMLLNLNKKQSRRIEEVLLSHRPGIASIKDVHLFLQGQLPKILTAKQYGAWSSLLHYPEYESAGGAYSLAY